MNAEPEATRTEHWDYFGLVQHNGSASLLPMGLVGAKADKQTPSSSY
jgi:hypothetical protein